MRDEAVVSSSVSLMHWRQFQGIESVYMRWAKKQARFLSFDYSSL